MAVLSSAAATSRIGEVIETSTSGFIAESDQLHELPELGALVGVGGLDGSPTFYGVVAFGATGGIDTSRKAIRRGSAGLEDDAIYARHPELDLILRTIFGVAVIGYGDSETFRHVMPALPVPLVLAAIALAADALLIERALGEKDHIAHYVQVNGVLGVLIIGLWLCLWFSWQGMVVRSLIARARDPKRQ